MATHNLSDLLKQHAAERNEAVQACREDLNLFEVSVFQPRTLRPGVTKRVLSEVLFLLGHNPNLRVTVVTPFRTEAINTMRDLAKVIRTSEVLHVIFPELIPSENVRLPWNSTELTVKRAGGMLDPSVQAVWPDKMATGSRFDVVVVSGPVPQGKWYQNEILGRFTENGREVHVLG